MKLNIGSGYRKKEGFVNIDSNIKTNPDIHLDITKYNLPYEDETIDFIECDNVIEHLDEEGIEFIMGEFHRVIKITGKILIRVPYKTSAGAFYWRHKTFFGYYGLRDFDIDQGEGIQVKHLKKFYFKRQLEFKGFFRKILDKIFNLPKLCTLYDDTGLCFLFPALCVRYYLRKDRRTKKY